eukprot:902926-Amphidinium_carterae.3
MLIRLHAVEEPAVEYPSAGCHSRQCAADAMVRPLTPPRRKLQPCDTWSPSTRWLRGRGRKADPV